MVNLPDELRSALDTALEDVPPKDVSTAVGRLIERYRGSTGGGEPFVNSELDILAYAAYRMPATYAAIRSVLRRAAVVVSDFAPRTQLDLGGGTGAAVWAAADVWPSLRTLTVLERNAATIALGTRLAGGSTSAAVRETVWKPGSFDVSAPPPAADLVTMAYVLGELPERTRESVVRWLAAKADLVALVEPGTPDGYARIVAAREALLDEGMTVVAPCPHDQVCPMAGIDDWCHFAVRLERSWLHRYAKAGSLGFEDEKFAYVVASRPTVPRANRPENRVLRHPRKRKGHLTLALCTGEGTLSDQVVSKARGAIYRAARRTGWGDEWPPVDQDDEGAGE